MKKGILFCMIILLFCSCSKKQEVGKYVYIDWMKTIHIDRECLSKMDEKHMTNEQRMIKMKGVEFVDTCSLLSRNYNSSLEHEYRFCTICVDDETYKHISRIMERNEEYRFDNKHISQKVKSLYDVLKSNGEDVGSEQEFNDWFLKPGQEGYKNRKYLWDTFNQHGADVGANYEEFASWLGLRPASQA